MKKLIMPLLVVLPLAGCASLNPNPYTDLVKPTGNELGMLQCEVQEYKNLSGSLLPTGSKEIGYIRSDNNGFDVAVRGFVETTYRLTQSKYVPGLGVMDSTYFNNYSFSRVRKTNGKIIYQFAVNNINVVYGFQNCTPKA